MDLERLRADWAAGQRAKLLHFWGHTPRAPGAVDASCLSQWYPARFEVDGVAHPTAEHFMMAEKARLFADAGALERIVAARSPAEAKKLGRAVRGFDERLWTERRFDVVVRANHAKFGQNPALRDFLLQTGDRILVEASPVDRIWGIGLARDDERAGDPLQWRGLNLLGFALMEVRRRLGLQNEP